MAAKSVRCPNPEADYYKEGLERAGGNAKLLHAAFAKNGSQHIGLSEVIDRMMEIESAKASAAPAEGKIQAPVAVPEDPAPISNVPPGVPVEVSPDDMSAVTPAKRTPVPHGSSSAASSCSCGKHSASDASCTSLT